MDIILAIVALSIILWGIVCYNMLVRDKNRALAAWSDIEVQLKRRHDLIPKLVEAVRQYAGFEQATLSTITELRTRSETVLDVGGKGAVEANIGSGILRVFALAEQYPDLKANQGFLSLQRDIVDVEGNIQYARRYYNGAVKAYNVRIDSFPDLLVARFFGFTHGEYFEIDDSSERRPPETS